MKSFQDFILLHDKDIHFEREIELLGFTYSSVITVLILIPILKLILFFLFFCFTAFMLFLFYHRLKFIVNIGGELRNFYDD